MTQGRWQAGEHLAFQVVEQQRGAGAQALAEVVGMPADQQQADAGQPAFAVMQQLAGEFVRQGLLALLQEAGEFLLVEGQGVGVELLQVALQQQAWQVPGRPTAPADPPAQGVRGAFEQAVEAGIQLGAGLARIVVEDDPQRLLDAPEQQAQFGTGLAVAVRQLQGGGQAGEQFGGAVRVAEQVEPDHASGEGRLARAFVEQHALAKAGRGADQGQAAVAGQQGLGQARAMDMRRRQAGQGRVRLSRGGSRMQGANLLVHGRGLGSCSCCGERSILSNSPPASRLRIKKATTGVA